MRYQVLGPLRATVDGTDLPLGGPKQRLVLALLLAADGQPVSIGGLIDGVWGEDEPASAKKAVQVHVHHLRTQLGDGLRTEGDGYALHIEGELDVREFERAQAQAQALLVADPARASDLLREALAMWRGPPYADVSDAIALAPEVARIEGLRVAALGDRIEADLALGRHAALIGELEAITRQYSLHERFRAQHMLALYRTGRHVEALRSYEKMRRYLADEMGLEPSADLKGLEAQMLSGDPALDGPEIERQTAPTAVRGYELRGLIRSTASTEIYCAYQRSVGRLVTIRVLGPDIADQPTFIATFLSDTQEVAALEHPHIDVVFDTWREPGHAYQVTRWFEAGTLAEAIVRSPLSQRSALRVLDDIGSALGHAHRNDVIHGEMSATNVVLDDSGRAYLTNFVVGGAVPTTAGKDLYDFAGLAHQLLAGRPAAVVDGSVMPQLEGVENAERLLPVFQQALTTNHYTKAEHLVRALRRACGVDVVSPHDHAASSRVDARNPYKGLRAFQETDADDFYGREGVVDRLLNTLEHHRLVAVVGPSGSGKSSAVKAGLLPRLRNDGSGPMQLITEMFPGAYPFEELEDALLRVGVDRTSFMDQLMSDRRGLIRVLKQVLPGDDAQLVLVIDQFEEVFSVVSDEATRQLFLENLVAATSDPRSQLRVVITMRADFFDRPLQYPEFGAAFENALVAIKVPDDDELAQAISQPARSVGVEFEDGLVRQIVHDVSGQPGGLPLLQYALTELFDNRDNNTITLAAYQRGGAVFGTLGRRAEALYDDLDDASRHAIRQALLRMVTVDEGADDLRRRVLRSELHGDGIDRAGLTEALKLYGSHRLLTFDLDPVTSGPTVEVAHEALLREWPRLQSWIEGQRGDLIIRKRLGAALAEWSQSGEDPSYLPGGGRLAQFEDWADNTSLSLTAAESTFLDAAAQREQQRVEAAAMARNAELRTHARVRRLAQAVAIVAVLALAAGAVAFAQQRRAQAEATAADQSRFDAETRRLASDAPTLVKTNRQLALLLAAEAYERDPGPTSLGALQQVLSNTFGFHGYLGGGQNFTDVAWLSNSEVLGAHDVGLTVYDTRSGSVVNQTSIARPNLLAFDQSTGLLAVAAAGGVTIFDRNLRPHLNEPIARNRQVLSMVWASDRNLVVGDRDGFVSTWSIEDGSELSRFAAHPERGMEELGLDQLSNATGHNPGSFSVGAVSLALSSDGQTLVSGGLSVVRVWDLASPAQPASEMFVWRDDGDGPVPAAIHEVHMRADTTIEVASGPNLTTFTVDGQEIDTSSLVFGRVGGGLEYLPEGSDVEWTDDGVVAGLFGGSLTKAWSDGSQEPITLDAQLSGFPAVSASPSGERVAFAGRTGIAIQSFDESNVISRSVAVDATWAATIDPAGELLTTANTDLSDAEFYDLTGQTPVRIRSDLDPSPTFAWVGVADPILAYDGRNRRTVALDDQLRYQFDFPVEEVLEVTASPDGRFIAFAAGSFLASELIVTDARTGAAVARLEPPPGLENEVFASISFSSDSRRMIAASLLGAAVIWDTATWEPTVPVVSEGGGQVVLAKYSQDGQWLVTTTLDGSQVLRDPESLQPVATLLGNTNNITGNAGGPFFSADGRYMISTNDGGGRLWDLESMEQVGGVFLSDLGTAVHASDDARWLISVRNGRLLIWDLDFDSWPDIACRAAGRNMTAAEWEQFGPAAEPYNPTCPQWPANTP